MAETENATQIAQMDFQPIEGWLTDELRIRTAAAGFEFDFKTKWPANLRAVPIFVAIANQKVGTAQTTIS